MRFTYATEAGVPYDFGLDLAAIIEREEADPGYSFLADVQALATEPRISALDRICGFVGSSLAEMAERGYVTEDITAILDGCLKAAGFRPRGDDVQ